MKTNDEYRKENKVLYHIFAEMHDGLDDFEHDWHNWNILVDQGNVNRMLREMVTGALVADGKCTEYDSKNYIDNLVEKYLTREVQPDEFFSKRNCGRCGGLLANGRTMSRFNTDCICLKCAEAEKTHPDYQKAVDAEISAIRNGNLNFKGIGYKPEGDSIMSIKINQKYPVKVGKNEVEVTVKAQTAKGWLVETAKGRTFPVNDINRFILPEAPKPQESAPKSKLSMLDAAAEILKEASYPMSAKELIAAMEEAGLWKSGRGLTPANTLSAGLNREIAGKENPRFKKTGKGMFALAEQAEAEGCVPCAN